MRPSKQEISDYIDQLDEYEPKNYSLTPPDLSSEIPSNRDVTEELAFGRLEASTVQPRNGARVG
jgi:hypothetical protein